MLPRASRNYDLSGTGYLRRFSYRGMAIAALLVSSYAVLLLLGALPVIQLLYSKAEYQQIPQFLPLLALAVLIRSVSDFGLATSLRAAGESRLILLGSAISCAITLILGPYCTGRFGISGSITTRILSASAQAILLFLVLRRLPDRPLQSTIAPTHIAT
jgi:O-antigen/teichoic acid export membrane protein